MKRLITLITALIITSIGFAQTKPTTTVAPKVLPTKIGYVNYALLRDTLPQTDTFEMVIQQQTFKFQNEIEELNAEIERDKNALSGNADSSLKSYVKKNLETNQEKLERKYQEAQYLIESLQQEALYTLDAMISDAVGKVAKAKNYTMVLDVSSRDGGVIYALPQDDLTLAVSKVLNLNLK